MDTTQIILLTILSLMGICTSISLIYRMADMSSDNLWIEPLILVCLGLFFYLVAK